MNRIPLTVVASAALAVLLVGCGGTENLDTTTAMEPAPTSSAEPAAPEPSPLLDEVVPEGTPSLGSESMEELFIDTLAETSPEIYYSDSDAAIIDLAYTVCDGFESGLSFASVWMVLRETYSEDAASMFIGYSISAFCPEQSGVLE